MALAKRLAAPLLLLMFIVVPIMNSLSPLNVTVAQAATLADCTALMQQGSTGDCVVLLQEALNAHGASLTVDGDFGPLTAAAVRAYQASNNLSVDGIVGPQTLASLLGTPSSAPPPPAPPPPAPVSTGTIVFNPGIASDSAYFTRTATHYVAGMLAKYADYTPFAIAGALSVACAPFAAAGAVLGVAIVGICGAVGGTYGVFIIHQFQTASARNQCVRFRIFPTGLVWIYVDHSQYCHN